MPQNKPGPFPLTGENVRDMTLSEKRKLAVEYLWQDRCVNIDVFARLGRG